MGRNFLAHKAGDAANAILAAAGYNFRVSRENDPPDHFLFRSTPQLDQAAFVADLADHHHRLIRPAMRRNRIDHGRLFMSLSCCKASGFFVGGYRHIRFSELHSISYELRRAEEAGLCGGGDGGQLFGKTRGLTMR